MSLSSYDHKSPEWPKYLLQVRESIDSQTATIQQHSRELGTSLEDIRAGFDWSRLLIAASLAEQQKLTEQVIKQLDAIRGTLETPRLNEAREQFRIGQDRFERGLFGKALDAFLLAEQKNDVDFLVQFFLGRVYLEGMSNDENVVDTRKAEEHMLLAAKYAKAYQSSVPDAQRYCGEAHYWAACAAYLQGIELYRAGKQKEFETCLRRTLDHAENALNVLPSFLESRYLQAKSWSLLGCKTEAIAELKSLLDHDRRYLAKANADHDFLCMQAELVALPCEILSDLGPNARRVAVQLDETARILTSIKNMVPETAGHAEALQTWQSWLDDDAKLLNTMNVDIDKLSLELASAAKELKALGCLVIQSKIDCLQALEAPDRSRLNEINRSKEEYKGTGIGWLLLLICWIPAIVDASHPAPSAAHSSDDTVLGSAFIGVLLFVFRKRIGSWFRNPSLDSEVAVIHQRIAQRNSEAQITMWQGRLSTLKNDGQCKLNAKP